jgi:O-methyltransferase involved in polyketide biosynthesis
VAGPDAISPTAHYTGEVWLRNGLSHPLLGTIEGRVLFDALAPAMVASRLTGGPSLQPYLLARHRAIDARLERAISDGRITQVIEVAAGMSPRGWRLAQRHGDRLTYVEADLPAMAARKRRALQRIGTLSDHHRVVDLDALRDSGPLSLAAVAGELDADDGLAILTEGLLGYLPSDAVDALWRRFAQTLDGFSAGVYLSDLHLGSVQSPVIWAFRQALGAFVRGRVHLHFEGAQAAEAALRDCGFARARVRPAAELVDPAPDGRGARLAHILEATTS